jgi:hypothetical protein
VFASFIYQFGHNETKESFSEWINKRRELIELIELLNVGNITFEELKKLMKPEATFLPLLSKNNNFYNKKFLVLSSNSILKLDRFTISKNKLSLQQNQSDLLPLKQPTNKNNLNISNNNNNINKYQESLSPLSTSSTLIINDDQQGFQDLSPSSPLSSTSPSLSSSPSLPFPPRYRYFDRYFIAGFGQVCFFFFFYFKCCYFSKFKIKIKPTIEELRNVLESFEKKGIKKVKYVLLRGEPIIYIQSKAYCLRDFQFPLKPISYYRGISQENIEWMEENLRKEIISHLSSSKKLLLYKEIADNNSLESYYLDNIEEGDIQTFSQIIQQIQKEKENFFEIDYKRIPIPPTSNQEEQYYDLLFQISKESTSIPILFNCSR